MQHRGSVAVLGLALSAALAAGAGAEEVFVGTVTLPGSIKPASVPLTLTIREFTSDDRTLEIADVLHKAGHAAAVAEIAKEEAGTLRLGEGTSFRANVIRFEKTATGRIVRVVTDRPIHVAKAGAAPALPAGAVGYLELKLGVGGEGSGRLLPAVTIVFDSEGFLAPENLGEAWPVSNVKPGK